MDEDNDLGIPPEMAQMLESMARQMFEAVAPMLRTNVRACLERNDKLVNQDPTALEFLTEELINSILAPQF